MKVINKDTQWVRSDAPGSITVTKGDTETTYTGLRLVLVEDRLFAALPSEVVFIEELVELT